MVGKAPWSLPDALQGFKTMSTNAYFRQVQEGLWEPVRRRLWHRNYYDRIIRNEEELRAIREYIENNPARWALDEENPENRDDS